MSKEDAQDVAVEIKRFVAEATATAAELCDRTGLAIEYRHVQEALEEVLAVSRAEHLLRRGLTRDHILTLLDKFPFAKLFPLVLTEVHLEMSVIPLGALRRLEERTVKAHGEVWRVHQNDADPFPSNPHAHNLNSGLKLHLGTGELFNKGQSAGKIKRKDLLDIREKLAGMALPALLV